MEKGIGNDQIQFCNQTNKKPLRARYDFACWNRSPLRLIITNQKGDRKMPYLATTSYYPPSKIDELIKTYFEVLTKYPHDDSLGETVMQGVTRTKKGMKAILVINVKEGNLQKVITLLEKQTVMFRNIEGFTSRTEIWATMEEGYAQLDMTPP
jgi:hypothetical protein